MASTAALIFASSFVDHGRRHLVDRLGQRRALRVERLGLRLQAVGQRGLVEQRPSSPSAPGPTRRLLAGWNGFIW